MTTDMQQKILDAVDAGFDAQLATTRDFVAIPSTRGAEGPCQDMIGDLLRQRGYEVDDWHIDVEDLKDLRGFGPIEELVYYEESARANAPDGFGRIGRVLAGPTIIGAGSPEQKAKYLPRILDASEIWSQRL